MKKITVGSGITKKVRVRIESFEDMVEYNEQAHKNGCDAIEQIETQARRILEDAGFPIDPSAYFERAAPDMQTPEWYALEVIKKIGWINTEIAKGNPAGVRRAANLGVYVGQLWAEASMKFAFEDDVLTRRKQLKKRKKQAKDAANKNRRTAEHARWKIEADRILKDREHRGIKTILSKMALADLVKKNLSLNETADTISRRI